MGSDWDRQTIGFLRLGGGSGSAYGNGQGRENSQREGEEQGKEEKDGMGHRAHCNDQNLEPIYFACIFRAVRFFSPMKFSMAVH